MQLYYSYEPRFALLYPDELSVNKKVSLYTLMFSVFLPVSEKAVGDRDAEFVCSNGKSVFHLNTSS